MNSMVNDTYWADTINFINTNIKTGDKLIAPSDFATEFKHAYRYSSTHKEDTNNFQWVVLHKGMLEEIDLNFLKTTTEELIPVFANEVFVIFSQNKNMSKLSNTFQHLQAFNNLFSKVYKKSLTNMNNVYKVEKISNAREIGNISRSDIERISCKNSQTTYIGNETLICRVLSKYIFYCDSNDPGITPHLSLDGYWESWITIAMARTIRKGWKCIDIGANHGYFSVLMADAVGPSGNVLAIEPNPRLVQMLERTLSVNGFDSNTIVLQKAISNTNNQKAKLFIPRNHGINATILTQELKTDDEVIEIETITLDDLTKDWDRVDFIKIDAEGAEELIWQGMQKVLNENKNITIVLEINCSRYAQPKEFLQEIQANGFKLRHIDYDSQIKDLTIEECLNSRVGDDWMLFLQR